MTSPQMNFGHKYQVTKVNLFLMQRNNSFYIYIVVNYDIIYSNLFITLCLLSVKRR